MVSGGALQRGVVSYQKRKEKRREGRHGNHHFQQNPIPLIPPYRTGVECVLGVLRKHSKAFTSRCPSLEEADRIAEGELEVQHLRPGGRRLRRRLLQ